MAAKRRKPGTALKWRGFLLHLTHYDPVWNKGKKRERRYDRATAHAVIDAMADAGMNLLVIDVKDAVVYRRLPELRKRYSVPMRELVELARHARERGLEVVPKMNFSMSPLYRHSHWFEPLQADPPGAAFWKRGLAAVDEVVAAVRPGIVHVGMDEDDTRSPAEYARDLRRLHRELKRRGLRMAIWADVCHRWRPQQRWKEIPAIRSLARDVMLLPWHYEQVPEGWLKWMRGRGFEVIGTCSCRSRLPGGRIAGKALRNTRDWVRAIRKHRCSGVLVTNWIRCSRANRRVLVETVRRCGRLLAVKGVQ